MERERQRQREGEWEGEREREEERERERKKGGREVEEGERTDFHCDEERERPLQWNRPPLSPHLPRSLRQSYCSSPVPYWTGSMENTEDNGQFYKGYNIS